MTSQAAKTKNQVLRIEQMNRFFDYFGTYSSTAASGRGVFRMQNQLDLYLLNAMNEWDIAEPVQFSFSNFLIGSGAISDSRKRKSIDANVSAMTTVVEECEGESFCPSIPLSYDEWQLSIASTPWIVVASLFASWALSVTLTIFNRPQSLSSNFFTSHHRVDLTDVLHVIASQSSTGSARTF